jgi:uncharacterized protein (DUF1778 family)
MPSAMKLTTLRIGEDLWALLAAEAQYAGVSVSQYIREAALARAAASAGARGEAPFALIVEGAREIAASSATPVDKRHEIERALGALARALAQDKRESAEALRGESRQAGARSEELGKRRPTRRAAR